MFNIKSRTSSQLTLSLHLNTFREVPGCVRHHDSKHIDFPSSIRQEDYSGDFHLCGGPSGDASSFHQTLSRIWHR